MTKSGGLWISARAAGTMLVLGAPYILIFGMQVSIRAQVGFDF